MRRDGVDLDVGTDETRARLLKAVHSAQAWAQVAVTEVLVGQGAFLSSVGSGEQLIAGDVVVEEERRGHVRAVSSTGGGDEGTAARPFRSCYRPQEGLQGGLKHSLHTQTIGMMDAAILWGERGG